MDENARINGAETRRVDVKAPNIVQVLIIILFFFFFQVFFRCFFTITVHGTFVSPLLVAEANSAEIEPA